MCTSQVLNVNAAVLTSRQAWNTLRGRETVALARELLGGNGVVSDFLVAKAFADMEAIYTCATFLTLHDA